MQQLLTVKEVANLLRVSAWTLSKWARDNKIPSIRMNPGVRFQAEDVEKWIRSQKSEAFNNNV